MVSRTFFNMDTCQRSRVLSASHICTASVNISTSNDSIAWIIVCNIRHSIDRFHVAASPKSARRRVHPTRSPRTNWHSAAFVKYLFAVSMFCESYAARAASSNKLDAYICTSQKRKNKRRMRTNTRREKPHLYHERRRSVTQTHLYIIRWVQGCAAQLGNTKVARCNIRLVVIALIVVHDGTRVMIDSIFVQLVIDA